MFKEVYIQHVDSTNEELTPLLANAATALRFKHIFGEDLLTKFANAKTTDEDGQANYNIDFIGQLAYIMAMQAEALSDKTLKLEKLNYEKYMDWLEQFDGLAIESASEEILGVYMGNSKTDSESKKNEDGQSES